MSEAYLKAIDKIMDEHKMLGREALALLTLKKFIHDAVKDRDSFKKEVKSLKEEIIKLKSKPKKKDKRGT